MRYSVLMVTKDDLGVTKGDIFVDAYIANGFNGTQAALIAFDVKDDDENVAASIAYDYLQKTVIQEKLQARLQRNDLSREWILSMYKQHAENMESPTFSMQALDRLAHVMGIEVKPREAQKAVAVPTQIVLNLPEAPKGQQIPQSAPIDAEVVE